MRATLTVMSGLPDQAGQVFELDPGVTTIGRGLACVIQLPDQNVSRVHAELLWEGEELVLVHKSQVNRTLINGVEVVGRQTLSGGDEIQFADRVVLRLKIEAADSVSDEATELSGSSRIDTGAAATISPADPIPAERPSPIAVPIAPRPPAAPIASPAPSPPSSPPPAPSTPKRPSTPQVRPPEPARGDRPPALPRS